MKTTLLFSILILLAGCQSFYSNVITITKVRDSAMRELAILNARGLINAETDSKIAQADVEYRLAAEQCEVMLKIYKETGNATDYEASLALVKESVTRILDLLAPFIVKTKSTELSTDLANATKL